MTTPTPTSDDHPDAAGPTALPATATPAADGAAAPEPEIGLRWGTFPPPERCTALEDRLAEWRDMFDHGTLLGPFDSRGWDSGRPMTGADVYFLAARSLVGPASDIKNALAPLTAPESDPFLSLSDLHLEHAYLRAANLQHAYLRHARLEHADLLDAQLQHADLGWSHLEHAALRRTKLQHADLFAAHLAHASLHGAQLAGSDLRGAFLDVGTDLTDATVTDAECGSARVADVHWQGVNLAVVKEWPSDMVLGDEQFARKLVRAPLPEILDTQAATLMRTQRREGVHEAFRAAARANRQLASAMRDQGMNDEADHFAYRAHLMQRKIHWFAKRRRYGAWALSYFLDALAGFGYKWGCTVVWYLASIGFFALLYFLASRGYITFGLKPSQFASLKWYESLVLSVSSFHGRGFFQPVNSLGDPVAILAALEAVVGLVIEVSFIATFTQRFFGK